MDSPIVHNHYHGLGGQQAESQTQIEDSSIYHYATAHEHEHLTHGEWEASTQINQTMVELAQDAKELLDCSQSNSGDTAQNALSQIQIQYKEEMADFGLMKEIAHLDASLNGAIAYDNNNKYSYTSHYSWGACDYTTTRYTHESLINAANTASNIENNDLTPMQNAAEKNLETLLGVSGTSSLADYIGALNGLTDGSSNTTPTIYLNNNDELNAINTLLGMIKNQIEIDSGYEETKSGSIEKVSLHEELILESEQEGSFNNFMNTFNKDYLTATNNEVTDNGNVTVDQLKAETIGTQLGYGSANKNYLNEKLVSQAATRLADAFVAAQNDLTNVSADIASDAFQTIMTSINTLMKEMKAVLTDTKLTPKEMEEKLTQILQMMIGFLQMFLQMAQNLRSEYKQKMESANITAQKMNVNSMKADGTTLLSIENEQKSLNKLEKIMSIVETIATVLFIVTGSVGAAIAMTTMLVLDKTGVVKKWTQDLSNDEGSKVGGAATMTGIAMAATMLGSVGIDLLVERMDATMVMAIRNATRSATNEINSVTEKVSASLSELGIKNANEQAENLVKETVEKTVELAAKNASKEFYKNFTPITACKLLWSRLKGVADKKFETFVTRSVKTAIKDATKELENSFKPGSQALSIQEISEKAAAKIISKPRVAVASPNATWWERLKVTSKNGYNKFIETTPKAIHSGLWAGMYTAGETNLLVSTQGNPDSDKNQNTKKIVERTIFEMIQMLMESIAMIKGSGFLEQMETPNAFDVVTGVQRVSNGMQLASQAMGSGANYVQYEIDEKKAASTFSLQEVQAYNNMLHTLSNQDHDSADANASGLSIEEKRLVKEQAWLSSHIWDNMNAGSRVLAAQSI